MFLSPRAAATRPYSPVTDKPIRLAILAAALLLAFTGARPHTRAATLTVGAGGDLQAAINNARPGDTIIVEAGAAFTAPITLPNKIGDAYITIRSSRLAELPPDGQRVGPQHAHLMPKILSSRNQPGLQTAAGAHNYRIIGFEMTLLDPDAFVNDLVVLGAGDDSQATPGSVPRDLTLDRCYIHGLPGVFLKRGIALNSASTEIINSYISEVHGIGTETQAICGWNGPGPFRIVNNYIEAAGVNMMFGGAWAHVPNLVPSDIEIRRNHFSKPVSWRGVWTVKNLFELKNARRVLVEGNVFEHNWPGAQAGYAIVFTPRPSDSGPAAVVEDVTFISNIVRSVAAGVNILGIDDAAQPQVVTARRISITNNLFEDISWQWGGDNCLLKIGEGADSVTFDHNTVFHQGNITKAYGIPQTNFVFTNNLMNHNDYGVHGDGASVGRGALEMYFPNAVFRRNVIAGEGWESRYPADNFFPGQLDAVQFVDRAGGNYRLAEWSPYRHAGTDGKDAGCDFDQLEAALAGTSAPPPTPPPTDPVQVTLSRDGGGNVRAVVTVTNTTSNPIFAVTLAGVTGSRPDGTNPVSAIPAQWPFGTINPGQSVAATVTFPGTSGVPSGFQAMVRVNLSYAGGAYTSTKQVVVP